MYSMDKAQFDTRVSRRTKEIKSGNSSLGSLMAEGMYREEAYDKLIDARRTAYDSLGRAIRNMCLESGYLEPGVLLASQEIGSQMVELQALERMVDEYNEERSPDCTGWSAKADRLVQGVNDAYVLTRELLGTDSDTNSVILSYLYAVAASHWSVPIRDKEDMMANRDYRERITQLLATTIVIKGRENQAQNLKPQQPSEVLIDIIRNNSRLRGLLR